MKVILKYYDRYCDNQFQIDFEWDYPVLPKKGDDFSLYNFVKELPDDIKNLSFEVLKITWDSIDNKPIAIILLAHELQP